ncbi:lipid A biosynthesis lauroyl acyltransferase [Sulfuricurvum sp.]|uniref:lipid A biosynthesis lauroyl acyltransferase n=1 Tax=Sulfuricurvum sp. TaxID=2025608 RepID=UPI003BB184D5
MILFRLFLVLDSFLMALPRSWRKSFFIFLSTLAYTFDRKRKKIIQQNLMFAFENSLDPQEYETISRYCYRNLALNFLQVMENRRNSSADLRAKVHFKNPEIVEKLLREDRGIIFLSAHYGNWEIGAAALADLMTPIHSIYRTLNNKAFAPYLLEARARHRMHMTEKSGALKHLTRTLKNRQAVSLLIDQASNARSGVKINFFGHPTYQTSTPAILSYKYNAPIVALYIQSDDEEHYTITFEEPIEVEGDDEASILKATQRQADQLEKVIRADPKFWFWCHKRWKGEYKEIYSAR